MHLICHVTSHVQLIEEPCNCMVRAPINKWPPWYVLWPSALWWWRYYVFNLPYDFRWSQMTTCLKGYVSLWVEVFHCKLPPRLINVCLIRYKTFCWYLFYLFILYFEFTNLQIIELFEIKFSYVLFLTW